MPCACDIWEPAEGWLAWCLAKCQDFRHVHSLHRDALDPFHPGVPILEQPAQGHPQPAPKTQGAWARSAASSPAPAPGHHLPSVLLPLCQLCRSSRTLKSVLKSAPIQPNCPRKVFATASSTELLPAAGWLSPHPAARWGLSTSAGLALLLPGTQTPSEHHSGAAAARVDNPGGCASIKDTVWAAGTEQDTGGEHQQGRAAASRLQPPRGNQS